MRIIALVSDPTAHDLRRALRPADAVQRVSGSLALARATSQHAGDVVVIDPSELTEAEWGRVLAIVGGTALPVLCLTTLAPVAVTRVLAAAALRSVEVVLRELEGDPVLLRRSLASLQPPSPPARVLARLAPRVEHLPQALQATVLEVFCAGEVPRWADEVARRSAVPRRTVDRWMARSGLKGTAAILDVARLARAWAPLVESHVPHPDVAARLGYRRARMLAVHARRIVGVSPAFLGSRLSADAFIARLAAYALRD